MGAPPEPAAPPEPRDPPTATWTVRAGADLGRAIGEVRAEQGLTQAQVADAVGISRGYLAQLETGKSGRLLDLLVRVLRRLGAEITVTFPTRAPARATTTPPTRPHDDAP
jgi:transcriptional regulator with XRE-family HTH domain